MISEEDLVVASLAKIVGQELHTIDHNTLQTKSGPANKIDPRTFLTRNTNYRSNLNTQQKDGVSIKMHDGQAFFAGIDEALVQSMYPEPVASAPTQPTHLAQVDNVTAPTQPTHLAQVDNVTVKHQPTITENFNSLALEKTLKSIDKSLKSIDKTQKALLEYLTKSNLNSNISSE